MSDNVKNWGPFYVTHCSPYPVGYHGTSMVFFPRTREYEFPFRHGRGIGVRLPTLLLMDGPDGRLWWRVTSKVFTIGLWRSNKRRKQWTDDQGLMWAMGGEETDDSFEEIAEWTRPEHSEQDAQIDRMRKLDIKKGLWEERTDLWERDLQVAQT